MSSQFVGLCWTKNIDVQRHQARAPSSAPFPWASQVQGLLPLFPSALPGPRARPPTEQLFPDPMPGDGSHWQRQTLPC